MFSGDLEGKVKWLDNYQKVKQLRDALVWLPVWERDKRAFVPEVRAGVSVCSTFVYRSRYQYISAYITII